MIFYSGVPYKFLVLTPEFNTMRWLSWYFVRWMNGLCDPIWSLEALPDTWTPGGRDAALVGKEIAGGSTFWWNGLQSDAEFARDFLLWIGTGRYYACMKFCCDWCGDTYNHEQ